MHDTAMFLPGLDQVSADTEKMNDPMVLKRAAKLAGQAAEILLDEQERDAGGLAGMHPVSEMLNAISRFLKEAHLEYVASRTYDTDKLVADVDKCLEELDKMHAERLSDSSSWEVRIIRSALEQVRQELPEAAMESDDAVNEILKQISSKGDAPLAKTIDFAVEEQFIDWNPDHSSRDPYSYRSHGLELKRLVDEMAGIENEDWD